MGCERKKKPEHILIEKQHSKIQATELPLLIGPGLISCSFNLAEPENVSKDEDEQDPTVIAGASDKEGIMAFNKTLTNELMHALTEDENRPKGLRALNTTLYTLSPEQIRKVMATHTGLMVVSMTAEIEPGEETKKALLGAMEQCKDLEQVEIVANPSLPFFMGQYLLLSTCPTLRSMVWCDTYFWCHRGQQQQPFSFQVKYFSSTGADLIDHRGAESTKTGFGQDVPGCIRHEQALREVVEAIELQSKCPAYCHAWEHRVGKSRWEVEGWCEGKSTSTNVFVVREEAC